jgi:alkylated DNA repair dioxygenase AlkB
MQAVPASIAELPPCVRYLPGWLSDPDAVFDELGHAIAWEHNEITIFGRTTTLPRLTCWMGEAEYAYSGVRNAPHPMPQRLATIRDDLVGQTGSEFNSCLANLYRDGSDSIGYHSDDEPELGQRPVIASVNLGAPRRFVLRSVATGQRWTVDLGGGDLLIMSGESQSDYRHAVPKTKRAVGPRINLTFRYFHPSCQRDKAL